MGLGSRLLRPVRFVGWFCAFLGSVAAIAASVLPGALYFLLFDWMVVGLWLGHGERPGRVLLVAIFVLAVTSLLYWQLGTFVLNASVVPPTVGSPSWRNALYYSLVSFASLGYGSWTPTPLGWVRWVGGMESVLGIFSAVLFSVTLAQRITR